MVLSADPVGLDMLVRGVDNHKAIAAEGFGIPYDQVDKALRHAAKFIVYGLGYGRGSSSIAEQLRRPKSWVDGFILRLKQRLSGWEAWRQSLEQQQKLHDCLVNPFGRRRFWYTRQITEMYNFPPSSTAADMMYIACRETDEQLPKGATVRLTVHDELVVVSHRDVARQATECMSAVMNQAWPRIVQASRRPEIVKKFYPQGWSCPAEAVYGLNNWRETKQDPANPNSDAAFDAMQTRFRKELGL